MILMGDRSSVFSPARTKSTISESHLPCSESCDIVDLATQSIETALTATFTYRDGKIYRGTKEAGWYNKTLGYRQVRFNGKVYYTHRIVWLIFHKDWPTGEIDHIDRNKLNNTINNLRDNTSMNKRNRAGIKGYYKCRNKWCASIKYNYKRYYLGSFNTKEEAAIAYWTARKEFDKK